MSPEETKKWHQQNRHWHVHPVHWIMHGCTALIVFCLGVVADVYIAERIRNQPRRVYWGAGQMQTNYINTNTVTFSEKVRFGFREDGHVLWIKDGP